MDSIFHKKSIQSLNAAIKDLHSTRAFNRKICTNMVHKALFIDIDSISSHCRKQMDDRKSISIASPQKQSSALFIDIDSISSHHRKQMEESSYITGNQFSLQVHKNRVHWQKPS